MWASVVAPRGLQSTGSIVVAHAIGGPRHVRPS